MRAPLSPEETAATENFMAQMLTVAIYCMDVGSTIAELQDVLADFIRNNAPLEADIDDEAIRFLSCQMSRAIWGAMPNPSKKFVVERLHAIGRNDRCVSGLNCKHKQCCGSQPSAPMLDASMCWAALCEILPAHRLDDMIASGRLPDGMIVLVAQRLLDTDPARVCALIEPHFAGVISSRDKHLGELLLVLCDAYDATKQVPRKLKILERVAAEATGQPRADALQHLATIASDRGNYAEAWTFFARAKETSPDDPSLSHLEVVMLLGEGRRADACVRARYWLAKLERSGLAEEAAPVLSWLADIAEGHDPEQAMADLNAHGLGEMSRRLLAAIKAGLSRPVDSRHLQLAPIGQGASPEEVDYVDLKKSLTTRLRKMGIPIDQISAQVDTLIAQMKSDESRVKTEGSPKPPAADETEFILQTNEAMAAVEADWHRAWPLGKPFSTSPMPHETSDVWAMPSTEFWIMFLENHPEAFNSHDILDDVAIALEWIPDDPSGWTTIAIRRQLYVRAGELLRPLVNEATRLPWLCEQNRPALRLMVGDAFDRYESVDREWLPQMRAILRLNPNDNHGLRDYVVNAFLFQNDDKGALDILARYPDDVAPTMVMGRVLALFRLGQMSAAQKAIDQANMLCPKAVKWLMPQRKAAPKTTTSYGIEVGGDEEAWNYRQEMREIWVATPGLMAWLKKAAK